MCGSARADDDGPKAAPRTVLQIGDASIVLIAADSNLYAFIDRVEDNAPVKDAELSIDSADGTSLTLVRKTDGLFIAPFNRTGHMHDAFMVSLRSPDGTGDAQAEITYDDLPAAPAPVVANMSSKLAIAGVSASVGALVSAMVMLWARGRRKRPSAAPAGTTTQPA